MKYGKFFRKKTELINLYLKKKKNTTIVNCEAMVSGTKQDATNDPQKVYSSLPSLPSLSGITSFPTIWEQVL